MTTNKVHDPENRRCYAKSITYGSSTIASTDCTCEKQQPPTSVTGDEWEEKIIHNFTNGFATSLRPSNEAMVATRLLRKELPKLFLAHRTHIKQDLREEILRKIVPSNYEHLPEHARAGAVLQDILHIINSLNEELA